MRRYHRVPHYSARFETREGASAGSFPRTRKSSPCRLARRPPLLRPMLLLTTGEPGRGRGKKELAGTHLCAAAVHGVPCRSGLGPDATPRHAVPCHATPRYATRGNATGPHYLSICRAFAETARLFSASGLIFIGDSRDRRLNASL